MGTVTFLEDFTEKQHALQVMIKQQESMPEEVIKKQITNESVKNINIGKIEITYLSGKKSTQIYYPNQKNILSIKAAIYSLPNIMRTLLARVHFSNMRMKDLNLQKWL